MAYSIRQTFFVNADLYCVIEITALICWKRVDRGQFLRNDRPQRALGLPPIAWSRLRFWLPWKKISMAAIREVYRVEMNLEQATKEILPAENPRGKDLQTGLSYFFRVRM